jgi:aspartate/methionine/tyrosine aminotransferase
VTGFVPPAYPYDRLDEFRATADQFDGGAIDCSIGTPFDPPPQSVIDALGNSGSERGYPPSIGTLAFREAAAGWLKRQLDVSIDPVSEIGACIGTKEFVASTPNYLKLRSPERDTVLYPAVSYPSYAMGATLAGLSPCRLMTNGESICRRSRPTTRPGPCACGSTRRVIRLVDSTISPRSRLGAEPTTSSF